MWADGCPYWLHCVNKEEPGLRNSRVRNFLDKVAIGFGFRIRVVIHAGSDHEDWVQLYVVQTYHKTKCSIGEVFSQALKKLRLIVIVIVIRTTWHVCQYRLKLGGLVADFRDS